MKTNPIVCKCNSCQCGIYTYEDSGVCKSCAENNHLSGAKKKDYAKIKKENPSEIPK